MNSILRITALFLLFTVSLVGQPDRWQQAAEYTMEIDFDVKKHQFTGTQKLVYVNNSPDELNKVFYHLFFNAFQPGSMMDERNKNLSDSDRRVGSRIGLLKEDEIGYQKIKSLKMNGKDVKYTVVGTILEVELNEAIRANSQVTFDMEFEAQVPIQIRRSGRDNKEGIDYSMAQWYPKMCEYDYQGWHANPYVGREFYGIWGNFDVKITIDKDYIIGGTGYIQNPSEVGYGYDKDTKDGGKSKKRKKKRKGKKLTWHFNAPNVHDFVWAADPDYTHNSVTAEAGLTMHFLYQKDETTEGPWSRLPEIMDKAFTYINKNFGKYPYDQYSFIQGGDGGMEYPMATLITGKRQLSSLVGVSVHELMHTWFQMILGTNESLYPWMDEGFTSYATDEVMNYLKREGMLPGLEAVDSPHAGSYASYGAFSMSGREEALITHSDHFTTNSAYGVGSYVKGNVFLSQLGYIIGKDAFDRGMLKYFDVWSFKHPNVNDFIRIMEKESGLELDWYKEYWINSTHTIDYGISKISSVGEGTQTQITLEKIGVMPMPIDLLVVLKDGTEKIYNIPLRIMRGEKPREFKSADYEVAPDWPWTNTFYSLTIPVEKSKVDKIFIDPTHRLADLNNENNAFSIKTTEE